MLLTYHCFKKKRTDNAPSMLNLLREYLLQQLISLTPVKGQIMADSKTVVASSLLKLYNALRGIATMK